MGVEAGAKNVDVKKRYMRLSLLIHPDKCSHPRAQTAFQAVSKASKELQAGPWHHTPAGSAYSLPSLRQAHSRLVQQNHKRSLPAPLGHRGDQGSCMSICMQSQAV